MNKEQFQQQIEAIEDLNQPHTDPETLERFKGWGSFKDIFKSNSEGWKAEAQQQLKELLGEDNYRTAKLSTLNSFYTPDHIVDRMWELVDQYSTIDKLKILEPGCGSGKFFLRMPERFYYSQRVGIDVDKVALDINLELNPTAHLYDQSITEVAIPKNYFDLVIGNVPYGVEGEVYDPEYEALNLSLHDYCIAKSIEWLRPGGLLVLLTSSGTLSKSSSTFREWMFGKDVFLKRNDFTKSDLKHPLMAKWYEELKEIEEHENPGSNFITGAKVKLLEAWKLPLGALEETQACADLIVLQKLYPEEDQTVQHLGYIKTVPIKLGEDLYEPLNEYFAANREQILGDFVVNPLYGSGLAIQGDFDIEDIDSSTRKVLEEYEADEQMLIPSELQHSNPGEFVQWYGQWHQRLDNVLVEVPPTIRSFRGRVVTDYHTRIEFFKQLHSLLLKTIDAQYTESDKTLKQYQTALGILYERFTESFGALNDRVNTQILESDPGYIQVMCLEELDGQQWKLADIFHKRVGREFRVPGKVGNIQDAVKYALNMGPELSIPKVAELLQKPVEDVEKELVEIGQCFFDPEKNEVVPEDEYLSGNVRRKLKIATEKGLEINRQKLALVQPKFLVPVDNQEEICKLLELDPERVGTLAAQLGVSWIPPETIEQFAAERLNINVQVSYYKSCSTWVCCSHYKDYEEFGLRVEFDEDCSPDYKKYSSTQLLEMGLNQKFPKFLIYRISENGSKYKDPVATEKALTLTRAKIKLIKEEFKAWVFEDLDRALQLTRWFNDNINCFQSRWRKDWLDLLKQNPSYPYPGNCLQLPGLNKDFHPRPHQKAAVLRAIRERMTIFAHDVGTGKTASYIMSIMENRRLGLAHKPMLVVLNGTEQQIFLEFKKLYPTANVILAPEKLNRTSRKRFLESLKLRDFDCVILTHPQFEYLSVSSEFEKREIRLEQKLMESIRQDLLTQFGNSEGEISNDEYPGARVALNTINRQLKRLETRLLKCRKRNLTNDFVSFEKITDMLVIDEVHAYRKMPISTKITGIYGLQTGESSKAFEFRMKAHYLLGFLNQLNSEFKGKIIAGTGTIIVNTLCEVFSWQKAFQLETLEQAECGTFDEWAATFARIEEKGEITSTGSWKVKPRARGFHNMLGLRSMMSEIMDIVTHEQVNFLIDKPKACAVTIKCPKTEDHNRFLQELLARAEAVKQRLVEPDQDNYLKITNDMVKSGISLNLVGVDEDHPLAKLNQVAVNLFLIWKLTEKVKGVQVVFCDFSTPKPDLWNAYQYLKDAFVALGGEGNDFVFIHDYPGEKRKKLFEQLNHGQKRIVMGSTQKLGTGCNIQQQGLYAAHHVDACWVPSGIEQREGRIERQGNGENLVKLKNCFILRYVTEVLDVLRWQTLENKQRLVDEFFSNVSEMNESEDVGGEVSFTYNQIVAIATGNPRIIEKTEIEQELNALRIEAANYAREQTGLAAKVKVYQTEIVKQQEGVDLLKELIDNTTDHDLTIRIRKCQREVKDGIKIFKKRDSAGGAFNLRYQFIEKSFDKPGAKLIVKDYRGFDIFNNHIPKSDFKDQYLIKVTKGDKNNEEYAKCKGYPVPYIINGRLYGINVTNFDKIFDQIDLIIDNFPEQLKNQQQQIDLDKQAMQACIDKQGKPFPQQERINDLEARLKQIEDELAEDQVIGGGEDGESDDVADDERNSFFNFDGAIPYRKPSDSAIASMFNLIDRKSEQSEDWYTQLQAEVERVEGEIKN